MHRALDDQPRPGQAHLPGVVELVHRLLHGRVQIGVGERDERRLPTELERDGREVRRRGLRDELPGLDRAREGDPVDAWVARERGAGLLADPLDDVERAVGQPGLPRDLGQQGRGERRPLGRLCDDAVAGRERRCDAPRREHQRRVPRRDHDRDTRRIPLGAAHELVHLERFVAELGELVGEETEVPSDAGHDRVPVRAQERAVVTRLDRRELGDALLDELGDAVQDLGPVGRGGPPPRVERVPSRRHGPVGLGQAAPSDLGDDLLVDRRDVAEGFGRPHPLAADPVLGRDLDALDLGDPARVCSSPQGKVVRFRTIGTPSADCQGGA